MLERDLQETETVTYYANLDKNWIKRSHLLIFLKQKGADKVTFLLTLETSKWFTLENLFNEAAWKSQRQDLWMGLVGQWGCKSWKKTQHFLLRSPDSCFSCVSKTSTLPILIFVFLVFPKAAHKLNISLSQSEKFFVHFGAYHV